MASFSRSGSSRRKAEAPGRIRIQLKGKNSKILHSDEEDNAVADSAMSDDDRKPPAQGNGIPDDLPEGTVVVEPQAVEDAPVKKKRDPPVRIDTSVLDNVSCTACGRQLNPYKGSSLQKHPELKVVICKRCEKFLSSGEIAKDKDGTDEQCRWCGEGGRLVVCDDCASAFCKACVMRNFNRSEFNNINSQPNWKCYLCNKASLQKLRENYRNIRDTLKALQARDKAKASNTAAAPTKNGTQKSENSVGDKLLTSKGTASDHAIKSGNIKGKEASSSSTNKKTSSARGTGSVQTPSVTFSSENNSGKLSENGEKIGISNSVASNICLNLEDLNVSSENVNIVMDKLATATNTFKEMLRALQSQFNSSSSSFKDETPPMFTFSVSSGMEKQEQNCRCAKALTMGLQTYVKSLKTILSCGQETQKDNSSNKASDSATSSSKSGHKSSESISNGDSSRAQNETVVDSANSCLSNRKSKSSPQERAKKDSSPRNRRESISVDEEETVSSKGNKNTAKSIKESNKTPAEDEVNVATQKRRTSGTTEPGLESQKRKSSEISSQDHEKSTQNDMKTGGKDVIKSSEHARQAAKSGCKRVGKGRKENIAKTENLSDDGSESSGRESDTSHSKEIQEDRSNSEASKSSVSKNDKGNASEKSKMVAENAKTDLNKNQVQEKSVSDSGNLSSDSIESPEKSKKNLDVSNSRSDDPSDLSSLVPEATVKDKDNGIAAEDGSLDDENLAAKFDLIRELADDMLKDDDDEEEEEEEDNSDAGSSQNSGDRTATAARDNLSDDLNSKEMERAAEKELSSGNEQADNENKKSKAHVKLKNKLKLKRKEVVTSSDEDVIRSTKKPKTQARDSKKLDSPPKTSKSAKKDTLTENAIETDGSSSDLLMSSDEDIIPRRQRKKRKETPTPSASENSSKPLKEKVIAAVKSDTKSQNGKASARPSNPKLNGKDVKQEEKKEVDEIDKEIEKLSKLPSMRKRKAKDMDKEDEDEEKKVEDTPPDNKQVPKKSKPGPKCSKKTTDYDDLSSEEDDKENSMDEIEEDDDEDEPKVTFFIDNPEDSKVKEPEADEENEEAKNGLLEDLDGSDDAKDDEDSSSSDEDSDAPIKKKKAAKQDKDKTKAKEEDEEKEENKDSDDNVSKRKTVRSKLLDAKLSDSDSDIGKPKRKKKESDASQEDGESSNSSSIDSDLSDDEDSEKDSDEEGESDSGTKKKGKKKQRKRKGKKGKGKKGSADEEADEESDEEGGKKKKTKGKGKKRKRIKKVANSSDEEEKGEGEDEDDDDPNSSKAGKRKQIRKVMSNKKLEDSTKAAAKAEEKRRKRIAAKQREFNIETITDDNNPMNCPITTKLVLEPGKEEGDDPVVQVNLKLVRKLKPHQVEAVQFMWDCMFESVKRSKKENGAGCILAHCMGLGKTLSVISFVHTILSHEKALKQRTCLVVSPLNTVLNWRNEWTMWLDEEDQLEVWELASCKQNAARATTLRDWHESGGIMIIGYEMYRNLTTGARCKNKRQKKIFQETLVNPGPDIVVCDEGHILKNEASAISKAMNQMRTRRRVVLTGTPLQNNLNEYHCMLSFVKPNLLGTRKEFNNRFISPIQNGQCTDSTPRDVKVMKARAHVLHEMLAGCVQRRDYSALTKFLPPKQEYVISVRLTNVQIELYEKYMELTGQGVDGVFTNKGARLFTDYQNLMKIWTHPWVLKLAEIRDELKAKYDDEDSFIDDETDEERSFSSSGSSSEEEKKVSDSGGEGTSAGPSLGKGTRRTRAKARRQAGEDSDPEEVIAEWKSKTRTGKGDDGDGEVEETVKSVTKEWWAQYVTEDDKNKLELSNKLFLLFEILRMCEEIGDKVLIFSQSILSLNIIESFLEIVDSKFQQECDEMEDKEEQEDEENKAAFGRNWTKNLDYYRMDGTTSAQNRQMWASSFNDLDNYRARLFLISTKAGGLGINLVAANRVIIFDASWNPSHDVQSIFRVYRFGQTKPCYIYRFLAQGTMEEKIYERQVTKLSLSQRVVDEHQIERHFSANDLKELYNFRPDRWDDGTEKPTLALPKDPLLAEILTTNKHCVVTFHEHDSLLENQIEQTLTEEEKKAAWEEYENEKKGIIIRGPGMERTASWPMMAAAQILSREQITATVQALRQQLPDIPEDLFHLHVQQALRRQVQIKQEEMRRMELLRLQEMNYLNMIKQQAQQSGMTHAQSLQAMQSMAPWMQIQRLRAMQNQMMQGGDSMGSLHPSASMSLLGHALSNPVESNKPEEAIDLDDN